MAIYLAKIAFQLDTALPRDAVAINPCYFGDNAQGLANALKTNLIAAGPVGPTVPFTIKVYDAQKAPPSYPLATASQAGAPYSTGTMREAALCLSYYSTMNIPGQRGRVYIPAVFVGGSLGLRPTSTQMNNALAWHGYLGKGLPAAHNLVVYSRKHGQSYGVDHLWVNDEWDVMRSRGLRETTRVLATLP
jgi:hypothetical protein